MAGADSAQGNHNVHQADLYGQAEAKLREVPTHINATANDWSIIAGKLDVIENDGSHTTWCWLGTACPFGLSKHMYIIIPGTRNMANHTGIKLVC